MFPKWKSVSKTLWSLQVHWVTWSLLTLQFDQATFCQTSLFHHWLPKEITQLVRWPCQILATNAAPHKAESPIRQPAQPRSPLVNCYVWLVLCAFDLTHLTVTSDLFNVINQVSSGTKYAPWFYNGTKYSNSYFVSPLIFFLIQQEQSVQIKTKAKGIKAVIPTPEPPAGIKALQKQVLEFLCLLLIICTCHQLTCLCQITQRHLPFYVCQAKTLSFWSQQDPHFSCQDGTSLTQGPLPSSFCFHLLKFLLLFLLFLFECQIRLKEGRTAFFNLFHRRIQKQPRSNEKQIIFSSSSKHLTGLRQDAE